MSRSEVGQRGRAGDGSRCRCGEAGTTLTSCLVAAVELIGAKSSCCPVLWFLGTTYGRSICIPISVLELLECHLAIHTQFYILSVAAMFYIIRVVLIPML